MSQFFQGVWLAMTLISFLWLLSLFDDKFKVKSQDVLYRSEGDYKHKEKEVFIVVVL